MARSRRAAHKKKPPETMTDTAPRSRPALDVIDAIYQRKSIRAFLPDPIPREQIERLLAAAARAPSGTNTQPWKVRVLTGAARQRLVDAVLDHRQAHPDGENWGYQYYPKKWREPYLARRRKVGWDLYGLLGLTRDDVAGMRRQHDRNFRFFDAPVGLIMTIDRDLEVGSWLDYGLFLQTLALAAEGEGLGTCLQACWAAHADIVESTLEIPPEERVVCGVALGHPDPGQIENTLQTERAPVAEFARFIED